MPRANNLAERAVTSRSLAQGSRQVITQLKGPIKARRRVARHATTAWNSVKAMTIDLPAIDQHVLVQLGVPTKVLYRLLGSFVFLKEAEVLDALGVSTRTVQCKNSSLLNPAQSGAMLDLMAITQKALDVLGGRETAEIWLHGPAHAFEGQRPIELLSTRQGARILKDHLTRMDHGVYA